METALKTFLQQYAESFKAAYASRGSLRRVCLWSLIVPFLTLVPLYGLLFLNHGMDLFRADIMPNGRPVITNGLRQMIGLAFWGWVLTCFVTGMFVPFKHQTVGQKNLTLILQLAGMMLLVSVIGPIMGTQAI